MLGGIVGLAARAEALADELEGGLDAIRASAARFAHRPRVFFEEWDDPLISGIRWVEELVEVAGGTPVFPQLRGASLAKDRIVTPDAVRAAAPDVILASWCGKKVRPERDCRAPGMAGGPGRAATARSTRSSRPTSCSRARPRSPKACARCTRCCAGWPACPVDPSVAPEHLPIRALRARNGYFALVVAARRTAALRQSVELAAATRVGRRQRVTRANELEELGARPRVLMKHAAHRARDGHANSASRRRASPCRGASLR